ncbi:MAG: V-type ATPase subunit [Candidatus Hecatellaceae archaeon]
MLKKVLDYGYLTPRVRGKRSFLLVKGDYDAMLAAENPSAALRRLEGTRYKDYIAPLTLEEFDLFKAERALIQSYQDEVGFVVKNLKEDAAKSFFEEFTHLLELRALIGVVKSILLGIPWREASSYIFPFGRLSMELCQSLVEGRNVKRALEAVKDKRLERAVEEALETVEEASKKSIKVETVITRYAYERLWEKAALLKGRDQVCLRLLGIQADTTNIMTVLRMKKLGFTVEQVMESLIPVYFKVSEEEFRAAASTATEKDAMKNFTGTYYAPTISPLLSVYEVRNDLTLFEIAFKRLHASECRRAFYQPFHLGEAFAYLYLKLYEVRDLIAILAGKAMRIPPDRIEPNLILHQPPHPI